MTPQEAKELSIKKWQYIVNNDGNNMGVLIEFPELLELKGYCPYCELYLNSSNGSYCVYCPIRLNNNTFNNGCFQTEHPYKKWALDRTKENAQKVLDLIIKMPVK